MKIRIKTNIKIQQALGKVIDVQLKNITGHTKKQESKDKSKK